MEEQKAKAYWQENIRIPCGAGSASAHWQENIRIPCGAGSASAHKCLRLRSNQAKQDSKNGD